MQKKRAKTLEILALTGGNNCKKVIKTQVIVKNTHNKGKYSLKKD